MASSRSKWPQVVQDSLTSTNQISFYLMLMTKCFGKVSHPSGNILAAYVYRDPASPIDIYIVLLRATSMTVSSYHGHSCREICDRLSKR